MGPSRGRRGHKSNPRAFLWHPKSVKTARLDPQDPPKAHKGRYTKKTAPPGMLAKANIPAPVGHLGGSKRHPQGRLGVAVEEKIG